MNQRGESHLPIILALFFGVAVALLIFGYMFWPKDKEIYSPGTVSTNKVTTNAANDNANATNTNATADATKDWKTYSNTKYGITFKHPNDWKVTEGSQTTPYKIDAYPQTSSGWSTTGAITFWVERPYSVRCGENPQTTTEETVIGGIAATKYSVMDKKIQTCIFRTYDLHVSPVGWGSDPEINVMADAGGKYTEQDLVLSTLQLTNPTAGWKKYENAAYGFGFSYSSDLTLSEKPVVEGSDTYNLVNVSSTTKSMTISILDRTLDPTNVQGIYGEQTTTTIKVGDQDGYSYIEGDAGCGGTMIQTALKNAKILRISFVKCEGETNTFETDASQRNQILSTFTFTK